MIVSISGIVVKGAQLGRDIGYPTANIPIDAAVNIKNGVYAIEVTVGDYHYFGVANIGTRPTIDGGEGRLLEAHLFNFSGNLYGKEITIRPRGFIRPEQRFSSVDQLKQAISNDEQQARMMLY